MLLLAATFGALAAALGNTQLKYSMASDIEQRALGGNLDAQRELADCLTKGCRGMQPDRALACAWRIVIVAGGTSGVTAADVEMRRLACEGLSSTEQSEAAAQARSIVKQIHGRGLVLPADFFGGPARAK
jgi:hypothetical protein